MFDDTFKQPIEMFGLQHILGTLTVVLIILVVFFFRKQFIKNKKLDLGFRIFLACFMLIFETIPWLMSGIDQDLNPAFLRLMPSPLCGHLLWISAVMLLSNSSRIHKLFYPLFVTGASMSLIFIDSHYSFPSWYAFQFFVTHGVFLLGAFYFLFTKKTVRYTIKDLGNSMLVFGAMGAVMLLINYFDPDNPYYSNAYFLIAPPGGLEPVIELMGQVGYTIFFIFCVTLIQFIIYGITYLCTKHRKNDEEEINLPSVKEYGILNKLITFKKKTRTKFVLVYIVIFTYLACIQNTVKGTPGGTALYVIDVILFFLGVLLMVFYEFLNTYEDNIDRCKNAIDTKIEK